MSYFSIIIPVYNRPTEVQELLESLAKQTYKNFEVIIVEDGSQEVCEAVVEQYHPVLNIRYFVKTNSGPGLSRNWGAERAEGHYFLFLDSDCIIPEQFLTEVNRELMLMPVDAFGGPDRAHNSFTKVQKAINYSMTSLLTTGGIRGQKQSMEKFHPRSFNMGFSKQVFETTGGFSGMRFGEDIDLSIRIMASGFKTRLFPEAYVFHKRRTSMKKFFKQVYNSGGARIHLWVLHPGSLKLVHLLPFVFVCGLLLLLFCSLYLSGWFFLPIGVFVAAIFVDSSLKNKDISVGILSVAASFIQLTAYGFGFIHAFFKRIVCRKTEFNVFVKNFYK